MLILDTNVLSELMRPQPETAVLDWTNRHQPTAIYTTAISEAEILVGIAVLPSGRRQSSLQAAALRIFGRFRPTHVLDFDSAAALEFARIVCARRSAGRPIATLDAQIAAIVAARGATVVTRNIADFTGCGFNVIDPWAP